MSSVSKPNQQDDGLDAAVEQAIAGGDIRAAIRALSGLLAQFVRVVVIS
ncbi:hypothetical protein ACVIIV_007471 [Bradyrhizobium sp. USDA 4354]